MTTHPEKMTKALHLKLAEAWWDGELEFDCDGKWIKPHYAPDETSNPAHYRIRPKPTLRPWKPAEVPVGALVAYKHDTSFISRGIITHTNGSMVWTTFEILIAKETAYLLEKFVHSTDGGKNWKPCGCLDS